MKLAPIDRHNLDMSNQILENVLRDSTPENINAWRVTASKMEIDEYRTIIEQYTGAPDELLRDHLGGNYTPVEIS